MDILQKICDDKRVEVNNIKKLKPLSELKNEVRNNPRKPLGFIDSIKQKSSEAHPAIIAEVKKKSPSKGIIREDFNHIEIAKTYAENDAACISILTDEKYFAGKAEYLEEIRAQVNIPLLRKDFFIDEYQIYEAYLLGADCILLIIAALSDDEAKYLEGVAHSLKLDVLIEVHDGDELERALKLESKLIGVNNRNLKTMEVSLDNSRNLSQKIPAGYIKICESGVSKKESIIEMMNFGYDGFLIGEHFMRQDDIGEAVQEFTGIKHD